EDVKTKPGEVKALPIPVPGEDSANDYQLSRALEMLKGLDVFHLMARGKGSAQPAPAATGAAAK
ncbi:MAG TPA: hypothetical protein VFF53_04425, partial [Geobacteraceae bacterium]|nr:hypothetical protein [Geobacteraceae bacterium]